MRRSLPVLAYHFIDDGQCGYDFPPAERPYVVSAETFREHLAFLRTEGYQAVSLSHYARCGSDTTPLPDQPIAITFDDGHVSSAELATGALEDAGMSATFFIITDRVGEPGFVTWDQARDLAERGMEIGSHSVSHRPLTALAEAELRKELAESRHALEQQISAPCQHISLPHGFATSSVLDAALEQYATVCTSDAGLNDVAAQPRRLKRLSLRAGMGAPALRSLLNPRSPAHLWARLRGALSRPLKRAFLFRRADHGPAPRREARDD